MQKLLFETPGPNPEGIAWDGEALWLVDSETRMLYRLFMEKGKTIKSFPLDIEESKGLTWDGSNLWVSDNYRKTINQIDTTTGKIVKVINAPMPLGEGPKTIEGLAWDGTYLWSACFAGWASKLFQVIPKDGAVKSSIFCECKPRGLASNGKHLWNICFNNGEFPSLIDQRIISEKPEEMVKTRTFLTRLDVVVKDPTGLTFDGEGLLLADRDTRSVYRVEVK